MDNINPKSLQKPNKLSRYYLAYGDNLNPEQMNKRCPNAKRVDDAMLKGYRLAFKGEKDNAYLTIEPDEKRYVAAGVYRLTPSDEASLDRYEDYPNTYIKKSFTIYLKGRPVYAFAYVMAEGREYNNPSNEYLKKVKEGYESFGFDQLLIRFALDRYEKEYICWVTCIVDGQLMSIPKKLEMGDKMRVSRFVNEGRH